MSDINITVNDEIVNIDVLDTPVYVEVTNSPGPAGAGVAAGGTTGQVLAKASNTNYDTVWVNASGGGVPYSGATGDVNLGEYELKAGQLTLDVSPTGTAAVGTTRWNDTLGSSETTLKGGSVILKNGVDLVARVVNKVTPNTTLTKAAYQAVRVSGAQGQRLAVELAQANNDTNSADTIGLVIETIATNQEGFIMTVGSLEGINTTGSLQGETWADGDVLYLSPTIAGAITNVQPTGSGHIVVIGYVEYAHANNGKIYIKILNGWELTELHDTEIVSPANNEALIYESSSALWKNKTIATALGYTPANAATTLTINGVTYDLSTSRTWNISTGISGSGTAGQVTYWTGASAVSGSNNLFWDNANGNLGIGTNSVNSLWKLGVNGNVQIGGFLSFGLLTANNSTGYIQVTGSAMDIYAHTSRILTFSANAAERARFSTAGNFSIGAITDGGQRLQVYGDTLLRGSGATSATTALTVQNSSSTNLFVVRNDGNVGIGTNAPAYGLEVSSVGGNQTSGILVKNTGTGVVEYASYNLLNNANILGQLFLTSSNYNGQLIGASGLGLYNDGASGITLWSGNASGIIKFATGSGSTAGSQRMTVFSNGNVGIGSGNTDLARLGVVGDTLLRGSGATSATTALTVQNIDSTNLFRVRNDGSVRFGSETVLLSSTGNGSSVGLTGRGLLLQTAIGTASGVGEFSITGSINPTSLNTWTFKSSTNFIPTSGTATYNGIELASTINQTGGANGITRGLYVNPTLTAAADFRAIETARGNIVFSNLPTSSAGLPSGALWNNGGVINIV